jgi:hypothetical protein
VLIEIVRILLLSTHLLSVNVAAGAPILCMWLEWRAGSTSREAARFVASASLTCLLIGGLLGLSLGLLGWDSNYQRVWAGQLGRKVFFAICELLFSTALIAVYWFWQKREGAPRWQSVARSLLLFVASTNLLYHFPALFFNGQRLLDVPDAAGELSSAEFRRMMYSGETPALIVHFTLASIAVAGLALAHLALRWQRLNRIADAQWVAVAGCRWSLVATLLQIPVGLWTLVALPWSMQNELLGSNPIGLIVFASALAAALWLARELVSVSMGEQERGPLLRAMVAMVVTVVLMTASHEIARGKRRASNARPVASLLFSARGSDQNGMRPSR